METLDLNACLREGTKKGNCRRMRAEGLVPAVLYGLHKQNLLLAVNAKELKMVAEKSVDALPFIQLVFASGKDEEKRLSVIKEVQKDPVSRRFWHIDFFELDAQSATTFEVQIHFQGMPIGVKKNGGEMLPIKTKVLVSCLPNDFVPVMDVDISDLDIGDTLKVSDISFGEKIKVLEPQDAPLLSVHVMRAEESVAPEEGAAKAEPEVIKQKSEKKE
ncbi:MAG: 50S ribosomal protein L25 [Deltaproteobacteria bacterium]|nr:50S ribosomal protein L25 [Deltaproteobacteria bacterium]